MSSQREAAVCRANVKGGFRSRFVKEAEMHARSFLAITDIFRNKFVRANIHTLEGRGIGQ
jgi:hypothetical protein